MLMRHLVLVLAIVVTACSDGAAPPPPLADPELPRGEYHLLVERISRAGERSWYTMTPAGQFHAPFPAPSDAVRLFPSPDGKRIAYLRDLDEVRVHLWVMDRDGGNRRPFLEGDLVVLHVSWAPDGSKLVIELSTDESESDIAVLNADGTGFKLLVEDGPNYAQFDRNPEWSPDGSRILFTSDRTGGQRLWTMRPDGSDARELMPDALIYPRAPSWSRDGEFVAFDVNTTAGRGVGVARVNGQDFQFFPVAGDVGRVSWLPDGRVAYGTDAGVNYELYARDMESGVETNLTRHTDHEIRLAVLKVATIDPWSGFAPAAVYESGASGPTGVAAGDVNGDGFADVVVPNPGAGELRLLRGSAAGFVPFGGLTATGAQRDIRIADVSGDREPDIIVMGEAGFHIWKGGSGGPYLPTYHGTEESARSLAVGDLDRDGVANVVMSFDLIVNPGAPPLPFHVGIWGRNGEGRVIALVDAPTPFYDPGRVCIGDVTGEGDPDVVALSSTSNTALILMKGQGPGGFSAIEAGASLGGRDTSDVPVCADFDGDGRTDVAVRRAGEIVVALARGTALAPTRAIPIDVETVAAEDVDRDGDIDLLATSRAARRLYFIRNLGDGRFAAPTSTALSRAPSHMTVADVNRDLWPDVVMVAADGVVMVARNAGRGGA